MTRTRKAEVVSAHSLVEYAKSENTRLQKALINQQIQIEQLKGAIIQLELALSHATAMEHYYKEELRARNRNPS